MRISLRAVVKSEPNGEWATFHTGNGSAVHNHKASGDLRVHSAHRKRSAAKVIAGSVRALEGLIKAQSAAGIPVSNIYATLLNQDLDLLVIPKDIANAKDGAHRRTLATDTPMEGLCKQLDNERFFYRYTVHPQTQRLEYLMWAHPETASRFKANSDVLVMDCTYKTNKFDLPLLNVIALTGMDTVLPVCQAWLPGEKKRDDKWPLNMLRILMLEYDVADPRVILHDRDQALMNALDLVFPDIPTLVCRRHMNKNVLSKTREVLGKVPVTNPAPGQSKYVNSLTTDRFMALFIRTVDSETEEELRENKAKLEESNPQLAAYLSLHWWKYENKIVKVRTNRCMHFGIRDTSTVEGTHAQCKRWIKSSRGDLFTVFNKLLPWWVTAANRTRLTTSRNETIVPLQLQSSEYAGCIRIISNWALYETDALLKHARRIIVNNEPRSNCTGVFRAVHGRPCIHEISIIIEAERCLHLMPSHFDKHWWLQRSEESAQNATSRVLGPLPVRANRARTVRRNTHQRSHGLTGTARDLVYFERVERNDPSLIPTEFPVLDATVFGTQSSDTTLGTQPSDFTPVAQQCQSSLPPFPTVFHEHHTPFRSWGYAGMNPYS